MANNAAATSPVSMERSKADSLKQYARHPSYQDCDCSSLGLAYFPSQVTYTYKEPGGFLSIHLRECLAHPKQPKSYDLERKTNIRHTKAREGYNTPDESLFDPWANCFCDIPNGPLPKNLPPVWIQGQPCTKHSKCCWYCHSGLLIVDGERRRQAGLNKSNKKAVGYEALCNNADCECYYSSAGIEALWKSCKVHARCCQICHTKMVEAEGRRQKEGLDRQKMSKTHNEAQTNERDLSADIKAERQEAKGQPPSTALKRGRPKRKKEEEPKVAEKRTHKSEAMVYEDSDQEDYDPPAQERQESQRRYVEELLPPSVNSSPSKSSNLQVLVISPKRPIADSATPQPTSKPKKAARISDSSRTSGAIKKARKSESSALKAVKIYTKQEAAEIFRQQQQQQLDQQLPPITYDSRTIARDILRAAGLHPTLPALNAHIT